MRNILLTFVLAFTTSAAIACEFVGLCPSDACTNDDGCADGHVCAAVARAGVVLYQCVIPCESIAECPAGDGDTLRCYDPQGILGFKVCADVDGVPGQRCEIEAMPGAGTAE